MTGKRIFGDMDKTIITASSIIIIIGLLSIYSATHARSLSPADSFFLRQLNFLAAGVVLFLICVSVSYQRFIDLSYIIYIFNIALLTLVLILGRARLGAQRWFSIGDFAFQPSEFIKLSLVLALASYLGARKGAMGSLKSFIIPLLLLVPPFLLVLLHPDLGTALLLIPIFFFVLMISGANIRYILVLMLTGLMSLPFFWHFLRDYQKARLAVFLNPNIDPLGAGYTIIQSKIAIGSGGLFGKGWLSGTQSQLNFLPERHTDFIFSVIGEEWGFIGAVLVVILYLVIAKRAFAISAMTDDMHGRALVTGIGVMIAMQAVVNILMTIGLMPVVGIPLPLVSYGGSSLISTIIGIALVVNVGMRR